jgi:hypothetical protein
MSLERRKRISKMLTRTKIKTMVVEILEKGPLIITNSSSKTISNKSPKILSKNQAKTRTKTIKTPQIPGNLAPEANPSKNTAKTCH